jgi:6-phospho-3-hexuloisomerase
MVEPIRAIVKELDKTLENISFEKQSEMAEMILKANRVFVAGAGRSGMMARCFAMRLMHMGIQVYMVGEVVTPSLAAGDLLIITSGSGTTGSLVKMAEKTKNLEGGLALVTIYPESTIAKMADLVITINAPTSKGAKIEGVASIQPMGSLFEQSLLICLDYIVLILMDKKQITGEEMFARHANLE